VRDQEVDLCIVGAGPAGLSAAAAAAPGRRVIVVDEQDVPGGSLLAEPGGVERGQALAAAARAAGAELWSGSTAIAWYPEDPPGVLAVVRPDGLVRIRARRYLYATGSYDQALPIADGDRPGMLSARACGRLVFRWGVRPGRRVTVIADAKLPSPYAATLSEGLLRLKIPVVQASMEKLPRLDLKRDLAALAALPAPASELPRQHGARVHLVPARGGFAVEIDPGFATAAAGVFAAGDVTGYVGPGAAAAQGAAAGQAIAGTMK
jgi:sarcosine oxidase subunit alpha